VSNPALHLIDHVTHGIFRPLTLRINNPCTILRSAMWHRSVFVWLIVSLSLGLTPAASGGADPTGPSALASGEFTVELNGLKLWYKVSGKGPVCLMPTPGWGPSSDLYFRSLKSLEKHFTVVYLDSRGTGRSGRAKAATEYAWDHLVADLEALRSHLKQDKVWLMGHSEGGMQILHYACKHPDRVAGLVVLASAASVSPLDGMAIGARLSRRKDESWFAEAMKTNQAGPPKTDEDMAAGMAKMLPAYWADPARIEKHKEHFAATTMSVDAMRGQIESKRMPFDLKGELKKVTAPVLIIAGDKDAFCPPSSARSLHLGLSNSKLLIIEDCGHFMWMEQAEVFEAQVPQFLNALGL
jgi:proline iminopeptidase